MCIAIAITPGARVSKEVFERCWKYNKDGFGMAYMSSQGNVVISKAYMDREAAWAGYNRVAGAEPHCNHPMLLHFRAATVGSVGALNCHPFAVEDGAMIHNGTFYRDASARSDSSTVAGVLYNKLTYDNLQKNFDKIEEAFGYNRVCFLHKGGKLTIINETYDGKTGRYGQWNDGVWYSNGGWGGGYNEHCGNGNKSI